LQPYGPCKTFAGAISKTASPGEIDCLDSGGFGALTITKSITIDCQAGLGSALSSGTQGIVINALSTDVVTLRNLAVQGAGTTIGTNGINIISAKAVHLENVKINNYSSAGLVVGTSATVEVTLENVSIGDSQAGVVVSASSGTASVAMHHVNIANIVTDGIRANGNSSIVVRDSEISHYAVGVNETASGLLSLVLITGSTVTTTTTAAFQSINGGYIGVGSNTLSYNLSVCNLNGGLIYTDGNNIGWSNNTIGTTSAGTIPKV